MITEQEAREVHAQVLAAFDAGTRNPYTVRTDENPSTGLECTWRFTDERRVG